jgi:hypothetical protein
MSPFLWDVDGGAKITRPHGVLAVEVNPNPNLSKKNGKTKSSTYLLQNRSPPYPAVRPDSGLKGLQFPWNPT